MPKFNLEKRVKRLENAVYRAEANKRFESIRPGLMPHFQGTSRALARYNATCGAKNAIFEGFVFDMNHRLKGPHPRINDKNGTCALGVPCASKVIEFGNSHAVVGVELKSTPNKKQEWDDRTKGIALGALNTLNNMLRRYELIHDVMTFANKKGFPIEVHTKDFSEGTATYNQNGIIGFKLDFHNLKKVDYEDFLEVCLKIWEILSKAIA